MGEADEPKKSLLAQASEAAMAVDTMGGRMHVRWDETAQATPHGQIVFFAEFLATAGVFDHWVRECPLHYSSPNASRARDVLGTLMLGILAGSKRYAHIAGVRRCFAGRLFSPSLHVLYRGVESLAVNMQWRNFHNSGANAISLAMVCGASRIVLLGFDCALTGGRSHHHGDHPGALRNCDTIDKWPAQFAKVAAYADKRRILVFNASRVSALTCFPRVTLEQVPA